MITFPPEFVATKYPGYFWNTQTRRLFSIKVTGEQHELRVANRAYVCDRFLSQGPGYQVSVKGKPEYLSFEYLKSLTPQTITVVYR